MSVFSNVGISNTTQAIGDEVVSGIDRVSSIISEDPTWYLGVLVEFVSTFCGTLGKQCWRLAAVASPGPIALVYKRPIALWLYITGILLTCFEPPLDSTALSLAPMSIICGLPAKMMS